MANAIKKKIYPLIDEELKAANERFGLNHSNHESFAVIREEIDEVNEDIARLEMWAGRTWEATKKNADGATIRKLYEEIYKAAVDTAVEAIQVAAMAHKAIVSNVEIMAQQTRAEHEAAGAYADAPTVRSAT